MTCNVGWVMMPHENDAVGRVGLVINGRLRLEEYIGAGAEAEVWRATDLPHGSPVAIKIPMIRSANRRSATSVARLLKEATLPMRVDSPHVVRVTECAISPEVGPYLVMDLIEGMELYEHLAMFGPFEACETAAIIAQICEALDALHSADVIHGDVKPENVVLAYTGGRPHATLVDFGIARDGRATADAEVVPAVWGTPAYMSPERIAGHVGRDVCGDLWSLAVVAYQCLVARTPFDGESLDAVSAAIARGGLVLPGAFRGDLPSKLDEWFRRAFASAPAGRFASALEAREALIEACSPFPLTTGPGNVTLPVLAGTARKSGTRRRAVVGEARCPDCESEPQ